MKKLFALLLVVIGALAVLSGCLAKDGLQGPPGQDGTDGTNGSNAIAVCLTCHTEANFNQKTTEYNYSKHSYGTTAARGQGNRFCARCHTNDGFQEITQNGKPWAIHEIPTGTKIQCETCHKMTAFDFTGDTISQILRTTTPVVLNYLNQFNLTGWTTTNTRDFTLGASKVNNLCGTCHQIRGATSFEYTDTVGGRTATKAFAQMAYFPLGTSIIPGDTATAAKGNLKQPTDSVSYLSGRSFSVHDGNQTNVFMGIYGYDFGTPITTAPRHHANDDCVVCHMNEWDPVTKTGGHSLIVNEDDVACNACHNLKDTMDLTKANIVALKTTLGDLMVARKMAKKATNATTGVVTYTILNTHDFYGKLYSNNPADSAVLYAAIAATNKTDSVTGVTDYINTVRYAKDADFRNRIGRKWTYGELGVAYNFGYVQNPEISVMNDEYCRKLLQASIDWLNAHP